ncbi:DUF1854 domain-containing protein [Rhodoferax mekongensis]|uniref:DUF1854 domain-containing protein n=1 Tax=Rhodoferax mekongensis TaxID=3068341 RepID=A0ABZ0B4A7_9BURK|nr:DUF1854 domain-containing protein [Rhodoferax sp. TBRC 17307]WNO06318.1 DUF1854 domain-containing protein [Rhodoferax sp. TBRC 17307]
MSALYTVTASRFTLERTPFGKLVLTNESGECFEGVVPVRAFPIQSPEDGISLVSTDGKEVAWVDLLSDVPQSAQDLIRAELATREFMPVIERIVSVTSYSTPCTWTVETDRGTTEFVLRGDEDIRRIGKDNALLIADAHGIQYLVRDQFAMDTHSKRVLDRFL